LLILPWFGTNRKLIHYHYYTGDNIDAALAEKLGMVAKVVPADQLQREAEKMAERIAKAPPFAVQMTKDSIRRTYEMMGMSNALDYHRVIDTLVLSAHGIEEKDHLLRILDKEGPKAFFEARDGRFRED
jgi:enoyl-CoA hydratase/carnithine racemase